MTNRLKLLSLGLVLAIIVAVADYNARDDKRPKPRIKTKVQQENNKRKTKRTKITKQKTIIQDAVKKNEENLETHGEFLPIPDDILAMTTWERNPFIKQKITRMGSEPEIIANRELEAEQPRMADFELLKIESVAKLGEKVYVIINGKRYGIGDRIDRYLIEDIYDDRVIFLLGNTRVMKSVGK